jgi:hypothetical protein
MAIVISTGARNHIVNSLVNGANGVSFDSGVLEIRTGSPPGPDNADSGTLLASISLPADAFDAASGGQSLKLGTWQDSSADASGTAGHFRMKRSGDSGGASTTAIRIEGTVGQGSGDLSLDNTNIATGQRVTIDSFSISMPA